MKGLGGLKEHPMNIGECPQEELEKLDLSPLPKDLVQKVFNLQVHTQSFLRGHNAAWINANSFLELFGNESYVTETRNHYIQIAHLVYKVGVCSLQDEWMGVSSAQFCELNEAIYNGYGGTQAVVATPFDPSQACTYPLKEIKLKVTAERNVLNSSDSYTIAARDLRDTLGHLLEGEYISNNRYFLKPMPWGELRAEVSAIQPINQIDKDGMWRYGRVQKDTKILLESDFSSQFDVVNVVDSDKVHHFDFHLALSKRNDWTTKDKAPLIISAKQIKETIAKKLNGVLVSTGYSFEYFSPSGSTIGVSLQNVAIKPEYLNVDEENGTVEGLPDGYILQKSSEIRLWAPSCIKLSSGIPKEPEEITFKIRDIPGGRKHPLINQERERWVNRDELIESIKRRGRSYVLHETFEVVLSSGIFLIELVKVRLPVQHTENESACYEDCWSVGEKTEIIIDKEPLLKLNILQGHDVLPIKKGIFQLSAEKIGENGLNISVGELKEILSAQAPKRLVLNQSFLAMTEFGEKIELQLSEVEFSDNRITDKEITSFGTISEETMLEFYCGSSGNIRIIDHVYSEEIQKLNFSIYAIKKPGASKIARTPLVVESEKLAKKIQEELSSHKYVLEGHTFTIPHGEGWDIEIKFLNGKIDSKLCPLSKENRFCSIYYKKAYAPKINPTFSLTPDSSLITLVKGEPLKASSLSIKVIECLENYTTDEIVAKGNWINEDELKETLITMEVPLAKKEKFAVDLESGRFLVEVRHAKGQDGLDKLTPKEYARLRWFVGKDTQINLSIESKLHIQAVDSGKEFPLKKIEFTVSPETSSSEHLSLSDQDVLEVLKDYFPLRIVKKQCLLLEMKKEGNIKLEVKEMKIREMDKKVDVSSIFGLIDHETEIIFHGKEETNLAIRTTPPILQIADPIKYLEDLGLGGIDKQFMQICRVFFSRSEKLREEFIRRGTKPTKGILFYGPPGTGKTTLARHIGEMLGCSGEQLQMLTATEIFNKWFGQSEENIREIFEPAKEAQRKYKEKSPLYVVIIDEIDALLPGRGGSNNKVRDSLVNQFLGAIDGLEEVHNLLVFGITNRKDEIDIAALRPQRLGVHVKIDLPNKEGRKKIFEIHTKTLQKENLLDASVDLNWLAEHTEKYSGADIEGIVEEASQFSLERLNNLKVPKEELKHHKDGLVTMKDFEEAIKQRHSEEDTLSQEVRRAMYL